MCSERVKFYTLFTMTQNYNTEVNRMITLLDPSIIKTAKIACVLQLHFFFDSTDTLKYQLHLATDEQTDNYFSLNQHARDAISKKNKISLMNRIQYKHPMRLVTTETESGKKCDALVLEDLANLFFVTGKCMQKILKPHMHSAPWTFDSQRESCTLLGLGNAIEYMIKIPPHANLQRKELHKCLSVNLVTQIMSLFRGYQEMTIENKLQMIKDTLEEKTTEVESVSDPLIQSYIHRVKVHGNGDQLLRHCHVDHSPVIQHILGTIQEALRAHVEEMPSGIKRRTIIYFLEEVFNVSLTYAEICLRNKLHYKLSMQAILLKVLENNNLTCASSHVESSFHTPLPLIMLIVWRAQSLGWDRFLSQSDRDGNRKGLIHQLDMLMKVLGKNKEDLELAYMMTEQSRVVPVTLGKTSALRGFRQVHIDRYITC